MQIAPGTVVVAWTVALDPGFAAAGAGMSTCMLAGCAPFATGRGVSVASAVGVWYGVAVGLTLGAAVPGDPVAVAMVVVDGNGVAVGTAVAPGVSVGPIPPAGGVIGTPPPLGGVGVRKPGPAPCSAVAPLALADVLSVMPPGKAGDVQAVSTQTAKAVTAHRNRHLRGMPLLSSGPSS